MAAALTGDRVERDGEVPQRRFMTFGVGGLSFALPLADVAEIIRRPALVPIPLGPPSLEGLARRLGEVLPVIGLRRALGLAGDGNASQDDAARLLLVRHHGQPVGLAIDRVASILSVPEERIGSADAGNGPAEEGGVDGALLAGLIRRDEEEGQGGAAIMILDWAMVIEREFGGLVRPDALSPGALAQEAPDGRRMAAQMGAQAADELRIVGFGVDGQEFALPIEHVQEIVALSAEVTRVPRARPHLLGVATLRDRLLPLIGLRELFGLAGSEVPVQRRVVVVRTGEGDAAAGGLVGVVVDGVREILRVERGRIDPVPPLMAREAEFEDMAGIARLDGGRRLVSILSAERLFHRSAALRAALGSAEAGSGDEDGTMTVNGAGEATEPLLVFQLAGAEYGLPVGAVQEVMRLPESLRPLPGAPDFVAGITTLRGAVLPVIDQRRLLRLAEASGAEAARRRILVIGSGDRRAGLLVDGLSGIVHVPAVGIMPAPTVSQAQNRLIRRVAHLEAGADRDPRMILLIDADELLDMDQLAALLPSG